MKTFEEAVALVKDKAKDKELAFTDFSDIHNSMKESNQIRSIVNNGSIAVLTMMLLDPTYDISKAIHEVFRTGLVLGIAIGQEMYKPELPEEK